MNWTLHEADHKCFLSSDKHTGRYLCCIPRVIMVLLLHVASRVKKSRSKTKQVKQECSNTQSVNNATKRMLPHVLSPCYVVDNNDSSLTSVLIFSRIHFGLTKCTISLISSIESLLDTAFEMSNTVAIFLYAAHSIK